VARGWLGEGGMETCFMGELQNDGVARPESWFGSARYLAAGRVREQLRLLAADSRSASRAALLLARRASSSSLARIGGAVASVVVGEGDAAPVHSVGCGCEDGTGPTRAGSGARIS
jgi:hypothetical protein